MSRVVVLGVEERVRGYALAGARVVAAASPDDVVAAWERLPDDTGLLVLTADAAAALERRLAERPRLLWTVLPE